MKIVTIATFFKPYEAHTARAVLELEGIPCFIADEHIINMDWLLWPAVSGIKLQVRECDAELAVECLKFSGSNDLDEQSFDP